MTIHLGSIVATTDGDHLLASAAESVVPCGICGVKTNMTGTLRCNRCWELEKRILANPELARRILDRAAT